MPAEEFENGILPVQHLEQAIHDGVIAADHPVEEGQLQPASLDRVLAVKHGGCKPAFCRASI